MTEKNFEKIEVENWYQCRNGDIVQITTKRLNGWTTTGSFYKNFEESEYDLVQHVKPPLVKPMPAPKKKVHITARCWVLPRLGFITYDNEHPQSNFHEWKRFPAGDITGEVDE